MIDPNEQNQNQTSMFSWFGDVLSKNEKEVVKATTMYVRMLYRAFKPNDNAEGLCFPTVHQMGILAFSKTKAMLTQQNTNSTTFDLFPNHVNIHLQNGKDALEMAKPKYVEYYKKIQNDLELSKESREGKPGETSDSDSDDSSDDDDDASDDSSDDE